MHILKWQIIFFPPLWMKGAGEKRMKHYINVIYLLYHPCRLATECEVHQVRLMQIFVCVQKGNGFLRLQAGEHLFSKTNPNLESCCCYSAFIKSKRSCSSSDERAHGTRSYL